MIKATAKVNGETLTAYFDTIGHAMQWLRSFLWNAKNAEIFDKSGNLYYSF